MILDDITIASRAKRVEASFFTYGVLFNPLPAGGVLAVPTGIEADSDFILTKLALTAYSAAAVPVVNPDYLSVIQDSGSGRLFQNQPIHVATLYGTAQLPFILPEPQLIKASSVVTITLTNNDPAVAAVVNISLIGFKLFYSQGFTRDLLRSAYTY